MKVCIKNSKINNAVRREAFPADILIEDGKITKIAENIDCPDAEITDAAGKEIYPGFVEAHSHIGLGNYCESDVNERNDIVAAQIRAIDGIDPLVPAYRNAAAAGVTTVCICPGSSDVIGGSCVVLKTVGNRVDNMVVKNDVAMKCAFGENPRNAYKDRKSSSRMTCAAILRETLFKAKEYLRKKEAAGEDLSKYPAFDMKMEALIPVIRGQMPLKAHAHAAEDIFTAIRIAKEFGVKMTLEHVTEGHMIVDELVKEKLPLAVGPTFSSPSKYELRNKSWTTPGILAAAGCQVSIITDASVTPQEHLPLCAGLAVKAGMDPFHALQAITINPAKHLGIEDRVGSIEVGKDADLVITDGSPFEVSTVVEKVMINGRFI